MNKFRTTLKELNMTVKDFCKLYGESPGTAYGWHREKNPSRKGCPKSVIAFLDLYKEKLARDLDLD